MNPYDYYRRRDSEGDALGVWVPIGPFQFRLRRATRSNALFATLMDTKFKPAQLAMTTNGSKFEIAEQLMAEIFAEAVVVDWLNITDNAGAVVPYGYNRCVRLLTDIPDLFEDIRDLARRQSTFRTS